MAKKISSGLLLLGIVGLVVIAVLVTPADSNTGGEYSTYSAGPVGLRVGFDLSKRLGWSPEMRVVPFTVDSSPAPVQVLVNAPVGAEEAHALLEHVRRGGALLVAGAGGALGDSLPVTPGPALLTGQEIAAECSSRDPFESVLRPAQPLSPVRWRRPAPSDTVGFGLLESRRASQRAAVGFSMGAGRIVIVGDADFLTNDVVRVCSIEADIAYVHMLEYLADGRSGRIAFDEFHHGQGVHGGSLSAIQTFVVNTPSGRLLGQLAIAGLLLLLVAAPRPLAPRDPVRVARRSPLEHADALAHAYAAVGATRTATMRLLAGVRRRTRRGRTGPRDNDEAFLATATAASPESAAAASVVSRSLGEMVPARELPKVAAALSTIERALTSGTPPLPRKL